MKRHNLILIVAGLLMGQALADNLPVIKNTPPVYKAECGSCHIAFPPGLLAAGDWQRVMKELDRHYGDNASLDEKTRADIEAFLLANAGQRMKAGSEELPRITTSRWFRGEHDEVPARLWRDPKINSPANCAACHSRADENRFGEREIVLPDGRKWED